MAIDCNDFKHDSNLTIEIILRMLMLLKVSGNEHMSGIMWVDGCHFFRTPSQESCTSKWTTHAVITRTNTP